MMPTRLQDGLSIQLLQWKRSARDEETKSVIVRINDLEIAEIILRNLENAGLQNIRQRSETSYLGVVSARDIMQVAKCHGVCAVTSDERL